MDIIIEEKLQELRELSDGNDDLLLDLLDKYITNAEKYVEQGRLALAEGDVQKVQFAVHTMKGSSLSLGLRELGELLTELNVRAKNQDVEGFDAQFDRIIELVEQVKLYRQELAG